MSMADNDLRLLQRASALHKRRPTSTKTRLRIQRRSKAIRLSITIKSQAQSVGKSATKSSFLCHIANISWHLHDKKAFCCLFFTFYLDIVFVDYPRTLIINKLGYIVVKNKKRPLNSREFRDYTTSQFGSKKPSWSVDFESIRHIPSIFLKCKYFCLSSLNSKKVHLLKPCQAKL